MPRTEFHPKIQYTGNRLKVSGTLDDPDPGDDPRQVFVFAFVTQHKGPDAQPRAKAVTVAGEAWLIPVETPADGADKWWLASSDRTVNPPTHALLLTAPANRKQTVTYKFAKSKGWAFEASMDGLVDGWAFGTAVLLAIKKDGTIETYAWSGWVQIEPKPKPKPRSKPKP